MREVSAWWGIAIVGIAWGKEGRREGARKGGENGVVRRKNERNENGEDREKRSVYLAFPLPRRRYLVSWLFVPSPSARSSCLERGCERREVPRTMRDRTESGREKREEEKRGERT